MALVMTGSLAWLFAMLGPGILVYGLTIAGAIRRGAWFSVRGRHHHETRLTRRREPDPKF
jgi:hypothetical protein